MKEKQVIVCWYQPDEKLPELNKCVLATVNTTSTISTAIPLQYHMYNRLLLVVYTENGWSVWDYHEQSKIDDLEIIAWCDIEPY